MSRTLVLIIVILLIAGGLYYLATLPREAPAKTILIDVQQGGNAQ